MQYGFTLIKLSIIITIIGIFAVVGVINNLEKRFLESDSEWKREAITHQHGNMRGLIEEKFTQAELQITDDIEIATGIDGNGNSYQMCFQYFIKSHNTTTDIKTLIANNYASSSLCTDHPEGSELLYTDMMYGLGFRNILDKSKNAMVGPNNGGNDLLVGKSVLRCGSNAGFSNKYKCSVKTQISESESIEEVIIKNN